MPAFLQSSFPPQVPVKHHAPVCRPFTLNTRTHAWKHPYQRRWRPGAPRAGWRAAWGMDSPAQICLILPQAEISVSLSAWEHIYISTWVPCDSPPRQEVGFVMEINHMVCAQMEKVSVQFSCSVLSDSLWPHGLQNARLPCPSPIPRVYSKSCPLSRWCHPTISSYVILFFSCFNLSQHQGLYKWVSFSHQVVKVLGFQLQYQSFQWIFRTDFL